MRVPFWDGATASRRRDTRGKRDRSLIEWSPPGCNGNEIGSARTQTPGGTGAQSAAATSTGTVDTRKGREEAPRELGSGAPRHTPLVNGDGRTARWWREAGRQSLHYYHGKTREKRSWTKGNIGEEYGGEANLKQLVRGGVV